MSEKEHLAAVECPRCGGETEDPQGGTCDRCWAEFYAYEELDPAERTVFDV